MDETIWSMLGIEPTTDERSIKRAYASRLKVTSPEKDPTGYMKLRAAYEGAKEHVLRHQYVAQRREAHLAQAEAASAPVAPQPGGSSSEGEVVALSPQQRAFAELHALLIQGELQQFLQSLASVKAAKTFSTLDEQYLFVGEIARLIQELQIKDTQWCGRVAELLDAREHENMFDGDGRYWSAYDALLRSYSALRVTQAQAHVGQGTGTATPGYLHVYHVLTSPFDAERLSALTRSQAYYRLAQGILERAKSDSSVVIPAENREWWERTALAGQHRPMAEPAAAPPQAERRFPLWWIWFVLAALMQLGRTCSGPTTSNVHLTKEDMERYKSSTPLILQGTPAAQPIGAAGKPSVDQLNRRLALCDKETREAILTHLYVTQANKRFGSSAGADRLSIPVEPRPFSSDGSLDSSRSAASDSQETQLSIDESDSILMSLLQKCDAGRYFDSNGMLKELPRGR